MHRFLYFCTMRWLKYGTLIILFLVAVYAVSMTFVAENKSFTIEKEINYPLEKVFPQFNNLQNFSAWNSFFTENDHLSFQYFSPYEGQGSAMNYFDKKNKDIFGDLFIRYSNPNKTLRYRLFEGKRNNPYLIDVNFKGEKEKTKITWFISTPKQPLLKRSLNLISEDAIAGQIDNSMKNLYRILGNKVSKEKQQENLKFDSLMVENQEGQLLLGINVSSKNDKNTLFKNIIMNHNKVVNYIKMDLGKKSDEYGVPVLLSDADNFKDKEVSYFYGIPLSKRIGVSDNNFSFKTVNASKNYVIYYRGTYAGRIQSIQKLIQQAKKDELRMGYLQQTFLEEPSEDHDAVIKLSLPVFR